MNKTLKPDLHLHVDLHENNVPVYINMKQNYRSQLQEYQKKLNKDSFKVRGPLSIKPGWIGEEQGMINWPAICFHDIAKYFETKSPRGKIHIHLATIIRQRTIVDTRVKSEFDKP